MKILIPAHMGAQRIDALRTVSADVDVARLTVERVRPVWSRAVRVASRRWLPYSLSSTLQPWVERPARVDLKVDGRPIEEARGVEVLLATWALDRTALRQVISALPDLRWVHSTSTGTDRFDREQLRARGIELTATSGLHSRRIAEFVIGLIYADAKRLHDLWESESRGKARHVVSREIADLTVGIVGYGSIGQGVARLARANGMKVLAYVRREGHAADVDGVVTTSDLRRVLAAADVVVVALPLTPETHELIGQKEIAAMRPGTVLVNVGRGATVAEEPLVRALRDGHVAQAYADVLREDDDVPRNHPAYRLPNFHYTCHSAPSSNSSDDEVYALFLDNLRRLRAGEPLVGRVDLEPEQTATASRRAVQ